MLRFILLTVCKSSIQSYAVELQWKRSCEESCTKDVMMYLACFFSVADVCFLTACFYSPVPWFVSGAETHPFHAVETGQNSPHRQRKEFVLSNDVSVWRGWLCWWWWWWGRVRWVWQRGREEYVCVGGGGRNMRSPTEMLNSITDWKRGMRTLYKDEEKRSTF